MGHPNERKAVWRMHEPEYVPKVIYHTAVKESNNNNNTNVGNNVTNGSDVEDVSDEQM